MTLTLMPPICLLLLAASSQVADAQTADAGSLLHGGLTWQQFLSGVTVQRELWLKNAAAATVPAGLSERMTRASKGLRFLIVAEDRCTDSVNTVPYIARLASSAHVDLRVLDRDILLRTATWEMESITASALVWSVVSGAAFR